MLFFPLWHAVYSILKWLFHNEKWILSDDLDCITRPKYHNYKGSQPSKHTCFFPSWRELQKETMQSCDSHQHITRQTAHQPKKKHVLGGYVRDLNCQYQAGHFYCHPKQTNIHLKDVTIPWINYTHNKA